MQILSKTEFDALFDFAFFHKHEVVLVFGGIVHRFM